jgi:hypothetical protein
VARPTGDAVGTPSFEVVDEGAALLVMLHGVTPEQAHRIREALQIALDEAIEAHRG